MTEGRRRATFRLYLITDRRLAAKRSNLIGAVEAALAGASEITPPGQIAVQLREKDLEARELYELARILAQRCHRFGAALLINDRVDVAIAAGADGVHLRADSFKVADARLLLGAERMIGASTHRITEVAEAALSDADFAVYGPVYDPLSKAPYGPATGTSALAEAVKAAGAMPLYALGGITPARAAELVALPSTVRPFGVAVIGAIFGADDAGAATRELLAAMSRP